MESKKYEQFYHTEDIAARIYGNSLPELFENAAFCMFDIMLDVEENVEMGDIKESLNVSAPKVEDLLINWLNELLHLASTKDLYFTKYKILCLEENKIEAEIWGMSKFFCSLFMKKEIKQAMYHDVNIRQEKKGYSVDIVFDV
ncbi:MAG: archease [Candidatus Omnitrophica bacterium]|nr:archease [Candidatus Omnitrophota bacterium]